MTEGIEAIKSSLELMPYAYYMHNSKIVVPTEAKGQRFEIAISVDDNDYQVLAIAKYLPLQIVKRIPALAGTVFHQRHKTTPGVKYTVDGNFENYLIQGEMELTYIPDKDLFLLLSRLIGIERLRSYWEDDQLLLEDAPSLA